MVEHRVHIAGVTGSSPVATTKFLESIGSRISFLLKGRESMKKVIPREKLAKKARKALDAQRRATWSFSPTTRKVESKKIYNRKRKPHAGYEDPGMGLVFCLDFARSLSYL